MSTNPSNEYADLAAARTALSDLGDGYYLTSGLELPYRVLPKPAYMRDSEPDGPIREPGDDVPAWHDVYTVDELCAVLDLHTAKAMKRGDSGYIDLNYAAQALDDQAAKLTEARDTVQRLVTEISELRDALRYKDSLIRNLRVSFDELQERCGKLEAQL